MLSMPFYRLIAAFIFMAICLPAFAQSQPPRENPYDLIGKIFQPFWGVLLAESNGANRAATLTLAMPEVSGRLPESMKGATLTANVQFPDKVKVQAPVLGETFTVCRNGNEVWATPGSKVKFLISQFQVVPQKTAPLNTPFLLPFTPQQAIFLPALFAISRPDVAEVQSLNGEDCRVLTTGLMPELARSTQAEDFQARIWVAAGYHPRRVEVKRKDFSATVDIRSLTYAPSLSSSTWQPSETDTDVYRTTPEMLEGLIYIVMNSLKTNATDTPWTAST